MHANTDIVPHGVVSKQAGTSDCRVYGSMRAVLWLIHVISRMRVCRRQAFAMQFVGPSEYRDLLTIGVRLPPQLIPPASANPPKYCDDTTTS
jgi:hypothetical protein